MMTSSNGDIFRVTGHLCGEFTGPRSIPHTKTSDAELWCFLWSAPEWRHRAHYDLTVMEAGEVSVFNPVDNDASVVETQTQ